LRALPFDKALFIAAGLERQKGMLTTQVLLQVGLDVVSSTVVRYQHQFQRTNKAKQKFLPSSF
jgi:hypothetical protein